MAFLKFCLFIFGSAAEDTIVFDPKFNPVW